MLSRARITEFFHCFIGFASTVRLTSLPAIRFNHHIQSTYSPSHPKVPAALQSCGYCFAPSSSARQSHCLHDVCAEITFLSTELPEPRSLVALVRVRATLVVTGIGTDVQPQLHLTQNLHIDIPQQVPQHRQPCLDAILKSMTSPTTFTKPLRHD